MEKKEPKKNNKFATKINAIKKKKKRERARSVWKILETIGNGNSVVIEFKTEN